MEDELSSQRVPSAASPTHGALELCVEEARHIYLQGNAAKTIAHIDSVIGEASEAAKPELELIAALAAFDCGEVTKSIRLLEELSGRSTALHTRTQFRIASALFGRVAEFENPEAVLPRLTRLRQLAARVGDAPALGSLHLSVARQEAYRGNYLTAKVHLETAGQFAARAEHTELNCSVGLVRTSLAILGGNVSEAHAHAVAAHAAATASGHPFHLAAAAGMLGLTFLLAGDSDRSGIVLDSAIAAANEVAYLRLGILDNCLARAIAVDDLDSAAALAEACESIIVSQRVPARSWYDLAHQCTKCQLYLHIGDWEAIRAVVAEAEAEVDRRNFRALKATLLAADAQALAQLGEAETARIRIAAAHRACPNGALDIQMQIERAEGVCAALRRDQAQAFRFLSRAKSSAAALGNRLVEEEIQRTIGRLVPAVAPVMDESLPGTAVAITCAAAALVSAGPRARLLAQRTADLLSTVGRFDYDCTSAPFDSANVTSAARTELANGDQVLEIVGDGNCHRLTIKDISSPEDALLVRSVSQLIDSAVGRHLLPQGEPSLWPIDRDVECDNIFASPRMQEVFQVARRLAASSIPILLTGETGTGKEVFARLIHDHSPRRHKPFVAFNCAAIPRDLVESQLFGHRKGAFTGAIDTSQGLIRSAAGGTLFLDEVGDLDVTIQPKLLRFIESGEIHAVGESRSTKVGVRIVAATNADLAALTVTGHFRKDLFYRLGAAQIVLPPLRDRKDEIPALTSLFLRRFADECQKSHLRASDDLIAALLLYDWPGNIRQLAHELHRMVAMAEPGQTLTSADLSSAITADWTVQPADAGPHSRSLRLSLDQTLPQAIEAVERAFVTRALQATGGRVHEAAQLLGISRKGLFLKRRRWGQLTEDEDEETGADEG